MPLLSFQGMDFDIATGHAHSNGLDTGWTFEFVYQALPQIGENPDTSRGLTVISPWAYATQDTAVKIRQMMALHTQNFLTVEFGDPNPHFPTTIQQRQIAAEGAGKKARVNAGLIAAQIARTTALVSDGMGGTKRVQNSSAAIAEALHALAQELAE